MVIALDHVGLVRPAQVRVLIMMADFVSTQFVSAMAHLLLPALQILYDGSQLRNLRFHSLQLLVTIIT